jgi:hypothetical protein
VLGFLTSSVYAPKSSTVAPQGYTGATGLYCTSCHNSYALNTPGGAVSLSGISTTTFNASQAINFSLAINHSAANRNRLGFSIKAVNNAGASVGTFNTTNPNAILNGDELSHRNAPSSASTTNSYTFSGLSWTAPADISGDNSTIKFYFAANAAYANFSSSSDFIYAGSLTLTAIAPPSCDTTYWTGAVSTAWETAGNWSCGTAPSGNTVVYINATAIRFPVIRSAATCKKIFTALSTSLDIINGYSLNVTGQGP